MPYIFVPGGLKYFLYNLGVREPRFGKLRNKRDECAFYRRLVGRVMSLFQATTLTAENLCSLSSFVAVLMIVQ